VPCHGDVWESGGTVHTFLTLALNGGAQLHALAAYNQGRRPWYPEPV